MGPYTALVGVLVFMLVVAAIGAADVVRGRRQASGPKRLPSDRPSSQPPAHAR